MAGETRAGELRETDRPKCHSNNRGESDTVEALRLPASYPNDVRYVETIETHRSWVFLTETCAYKLKKPVCLDASGGLMREARRRLCELELELNRRLAASVYLGVVPVTVSHAHISVDGAGLPIDWLVKMRRLPRQRMLDQLIADGTLREVEVDALVASLVRFYASADSAVFDGNSYGKRLAADIGSKRSSLERPHYGLSPRDIHDLASRQRSWLTRHEELLQRRGAGVVDAHGDLRPEHICLEPDPVIIDCLEFDRELRLLDPVSELSFLLLECRRLGAAWVGDRLIRQYGALTGDQASASLVAFYESYHALIRAAIAVWHLDDVSPVNPDAWRARAQLYLQLGLQRLS